MVKLLRPNIVKIPGKLSLIRAPYSAVLRKSGELFMSAGAFPMKIEAVTFEADIAKRKIFMYIHDKYDPAARNQQKAVKAGSGRRVTLLPVLRVLGFETPTHSKPYESKKIITLLRKGNRFTIRYSAIRSMKLAKRKIKYGFPPISKHARSANNENPIFKNFSSL